MGKCDDPVLDSLDLFSCEGGDVGVLGGEAADDAVGVLVGFAFGGAEGVSEEDLAAPSRAERGALDGGGIQELAAVVAGQNFQLRKKAWRSRSSLSSSRATAFCVLARSFRTTTRRVMRSVSTRRHAGEVPVPPTTVSSSQWPYSLLSSAPGGRSVIGLSRVLVGVGHACSVHLAPPARRPVGQLRPGHAEQPGVDRVVDRPLAQRPRQAVARVAA